MTPVAIRHTSPGAYSIARSGGYYLCRSQAQLATKNCFQRIIGRDHGAFSILVKRHTPRYYGLAYRTLFNKTEAEEVVQEAFLKLWQRPGAWDEEKGARFSTWFYRVVANMCIDRNRKKRPVLVEDIEALSALESTAAETVYRREQKRLVDNLILELPENQRLALNLCFYEGLSNREAADIMGLNLKALQSLIIRAKSRLKEKVALSTKKDEKDRHDG